MDGGAWWAAVHRVTKSRKRLSDFTFTFHFHALGKEMATHSSVLAWRIPGTGEPGALPSMGSHRVRHNWSDLAAAAAAAAGWNPNSSKFLTVCQTTALVLCQSPVQSTVQGREIQSMMVLPWKNYIKVWSSWIIWDLWDGVADRKRIFFKKF